MATTLIDVVEVQSEDADLVAQLAKLQQMHQQVRLMLTSTTRQNILISIGKRPAEVAPNCSVWASTRSNFAT